MPLTLSRTTDYELIRNTLTHPRLYKWLCSRYKREEFSPPGTMLYVSVHDGPEYLGLFALDPVDPVTWEIHTALLPTAWGERALEAYKQGIQWVWANTWRSRILGKIRNNNRLALRIARRAGLQLTGVTLVEGSDGVSHYINELEIRKEWAISAASHKPEQV